MLKSDSKLSVLVGLALFFVSPLQSLLGKRMRRDLKFTFRQIQPSWSFSISPTKSKRTISKRNRKRLFWKGYSIESPLLISEIAKFFPSPACVLMASFRTSLQYGGEEHLDAPPRELLLAQTEEYVEYSRHGAVLKGQDKAVACSKYEEDVLINNHTVS